MKTSLYETVKTFELRTDLATKLVSEVSARDNGRRPQYRIATFRVYDGPDGQQRRSPWLGEREMVLKQGLEKAALEWVADKRKQAVLAEQASEAQEAPEAA
jgi:hypothetical protein